MAHDIVLWKPRARARATPGFVYLCLCENLPCAAVAQLPPRVGRTLVESFGAEPAFELSVHGTHVEVGLPSGDAGGLVLDVLVRLAEAEGAWKPFDPRGPARMFYSSRWRRQNDDN